MSSLLIVNKIMNDNCVAVVCMMRLSSDDGERYYHLIVMASSRISSTIRIILGSNAKRVLDSVAKPILVIR
jgi:nucleotide-binding universal stress UspA family protein